MLRHFEKDERAVREAKQRPRIIFYIGTDYDREARKKWKRKQGNVLIKRANGSIFLSSHIFIQIDSL